MKRILALTLVLVMVLSMIPMASAADWVGNKHHDGDCQKGSQTGSTKATCTAAATVTYKCSVEWWDLWYNHHTCSRTITETVGEPLGHTKPKDAYDCTGYNCSVCGTAVPATADHTPNMEKATCSADKVCTACGYVFQKANPENYEYHNWVSYSIPKPATCAVPGKEIVKCSICEELDEVEIPATKDHKYTEKQTLVTAATCKALATYTYKCVTCDGTQVLDEIGGTFGGHVYTDKYEEKHANCAQPTTLYPKCDVCGVADYTAGTPEKGSSATGEHNYDSTTGLCTTVLHDGTVCGASNITYTFTMPASLALKINQDGSAKATVKDDKGNEVTPTVEYTSDKTSIATVKSDGTVTGVAVGTATITGTVTLNGKKYSDSTTVTVTNGAYIECANVSVAKGGTATLAASVKELPTGYSDLKLTYDSSSSSVFTIDSTGKVTGKASGYGTVTVDGTYKMGTATLDLDAITVYVGVYEDHTVDVVLKSTAPTEIGFDDTGIFSSAKFDGKAAASSATLAILLSDSNGAKISFKKGLNSDEIGTLKLNALFNKSEISIMSLGGASFILNGKAGTSVLDYTIRTSEARGEVIVATGTLNITSGQQKADITYKTGFDKAVTVKESDFSTYYKSVNKSDTLDYVMFGIGTDAPEEGALYINSTATAANTADKNMSFYYNYNSTTDKGAYKHDLAELTYVPDKTEKDAYVDYVTFTCYGESGKTLTGLLAFEVSQSNPFTDVKESDYFYDAVMWAVEEGITTGQTETTFAPNAACTRAQVVTFLWRAAGEPTPKTTVNPFTDVKATQYYYKAVLWAVEKGITTGLTATTFGPDAACTRAQVVTFLHRAAGEPSVTGFNSFTDVASNAYYYNPVLWAVKNKITNGMSATSFGSNSTCTRGQIVTFLYRYVVD